MKRIVVKVGSSILAPKGKIDSKFLDNFVKDILRVEKKGIRVILVSSGAIACGLNRLDMKRKPHDLTYLQAFASLGQIILMNIYAEKFSRYKKMCAQILLTWDDFNDRKRYINARNTINKLLELKVIPIINENDTVSSEEIRFGDNDRLSALVSDLVEAEKLIILSDVNGLYSQKDLVPVVENIDNKIIALARKEDSLFTTGGMITKLEAAKISTCSGIKTIIAHGRLKSVIWRILEGQCIGTVFLPQVDVQRARKRWIAFSKKIKGKIYIDRGAKEALVQKGKSLLAVGITRVLGDFTRGDCVEVLDEEDNLVGCGLANYAATELEDLKSKKFSKEIIHRDNFVKKEI